MIKYLFKKTAPIQYILYCFALILILFTGCENSPNELGLNYIANDTLGTKVLDSQTDTMAIYSNNFLRYLNTSNSVNMMVGKYQNYTSRTLLRFNSISNAFDSAVVLSAVLHLKYNGYALVDSNGYTSFNIYRLNNNYNFDTVTYDQFNNSDIGTTILGTYSGTLHDTASINITFDNQTIKDWLQYAVDTNYAVKNYGVIFVPNSNSTNIKAFYSSLSSFIPYVTAVVAKNNAVDTLTFTTSQSTSLNYVPASLIPKTEILLQRGVSFKDILRFDLSKLSNKVIINEAVLTLTLDRAKSFISTVNSVNSSLLANMLIDSVALTNDGINYLSVQPDSVTYTIHLNVAFQKWNYGISPNMGILIRNIYDYTNLDRYVFYSSNYPDISKRPRLKIRYTLRK